MAIIRCYKCGALHDSSSKTWVLSNSNYQPICVCHADTEVVEGGRDDGKAESEFIVQAEPSKRIKKIKSGGKTVDKSSEQQTVLDNYWG